MKCYIKEFLNFLKLEKNYSSHTIYSYENDLKKFNIFLKNKKISIINVNSTLIKEWLKKISGSQYSNLSLNRYLSTLKSFFKYLKTYKVINDNPMVGIKNLKTSSKLPKILTIDEMQAVFKIKPKNALEQRDITMIEIFYSSGIRVSEIINLLLSDVDYSRKTIKVIGKGSKQRIVPIGLKALDSLSKWLKIRSNISTIYQNIFISVKGHPLTSRTIQKRFLHFFTVHNFKNFHPHTLRHTFASHILESSKDLVAVQKLLGHENITTTQIYTHLNFQELCRSYDKSHPRAKKK